MRTRNAAAVALNVACQSHGRTQEATEASQFVGGQVPEFPARRLVILTSADRAVPKGPGLIWI